MRVVIQEDYDRMCRWAADYIAAKINAHHEARPFVLGLPTGSSPIGVYQELIRKNKAGEVSFAKQGRARTMQENHGLLRLYAVGHHPLI